MPDPKLFAVHTLNILTYRPVMQGNPVVAKLKLIDDMQQCEEFLLELADVKEDFANDPGCCLYAIKCHPALRSDDIHEEDSRTLQALMDCDLTIVRLNGRVVPTSDVKAIVESVTLSKLKKVVAEKPVPDTRKVIERHVKERMAAAAAEISSICQRKCWKCHTRDVTDELRGLCATCLREYIGGRKDIP